VVALQPSLEADLSELPSAESFELAGSTYKKKDIEKAFDELAKFLLDEYRKHKKEMEVHEPSIPE